MKKIYFLFAALILSVSVLVTSCRPPWLEGAIVHFNAGREDTAYKLLEDGTKKEPNNEEAWYYLGRVQGKKGMLKEMMESFDKSLSIKNTYAGAIELEKTSYFNKSFNDGVTAYNSFIKIEDRESEAALKAANSIIANFEKANMIKKDFSSTRLIAFAYQYLDDSENELKYLESAAEIEPDTVLIWVELGFYHMQKKDYNKAIEMFEKGLGIEPNDVECLTLRAQCLDFADRKEEAVEAYKNAIEKNPEEKAIPFNLGLILHKMGNAAENDPEKQKALYAEAVTYFLRVHELDPELKENYDLCSTLMLQLQQYKQAEELLKDGLQRFPESASIWQNWSYLQARLGNTEEAKKAYERSKQLQD
jgi:tetratricopeptide (TPR) repeat protein